MGCGGQSRRPELEHTDVEAVTDVPATDARFSSSTCNCVCTHTRVVALFLYSNCVFITVLVS